MPFIQKRQFDSNYICMHTKLAETTRAHLIRCLCYYYYQNQYIYCWPISPTEYRPSSRLWH